MMKKIFNIVFFIYILILFSGCGYQPLLTEKFQKFNIKNSNIIGDRKLGQNLINNFSEIQNAKNNLTFKVEASKKKEIANRSAKGTPLEYNLSVNFHISVISDNDGKEILTQNFSQSDTYKASKLHLDTLNRERKIVDNIVKNIADQITIKLNLIYN
ncbi:MAG: hypothetical protein CMI79_06435 [Candidatus Pelagibacter sp.]|nr:hypothetical protein [Candidatus Pelagibacter sp.]|tara:strand:- start:15144 stop:15614 length:471 start_codon:yes stop_codon:yes gene_type:complete